MEFIMAHPLFVSVAAVIVSSLVAFFTGHFVLVPKRCQKQKESCLKLQQEAFNKRDENKKECVNDWDEERKLLHARISKLTERIDEVYVRRDVVIPRLEDIHEEVKELRKLIYKALKINGG